MNNLKYLERKYYKQQTEWWNNNAVDWAKIGKIRDSINISNYWTNLCQFVASNEGYMSHGYPDCEHYSIGYGLLFKRSDCVGYEKLAIRAFAEALNVDLYQFIPIEIFAQPRGQIIASLKRYRLTSGECIKLLSYTLEENNFFLRARIKRFDELEPNQKIAIHSMWYNSPSLIGPNLLSFLNNYIQTKDQIYILDCLYEIECNSNFAESEYYIGLQNRRFKEGLMFSNRGLDFITRIPEEYFDRFLDHLSKNMPGLYFNMRRFFDLTDNIEESIKLAILMGEIAHEQLPDISFIAAFMRNISKNK